MKERGSYRTELIVFSLSIVFLLLYITSADHAASYRGKDDFRLCYQPSGNPLTDELWIKQGLQPAVNYINTTFREAGIFLELTPLERETDGCTTIFLILPSTSDVRNACNPRALACYLPGRNRVILGGSSVEFEERVTQDPADDNACKTAKELVIHEWLHSEGLLHRPNSLILDRYSCIRLTEQELWGLLFLILEQPSEEFLRFGIPGNGIG